MKDYGKKGYKLALIALVFAFIGWMLPGAITNESIFEIEVNNTNLAPNVPGHSTGTGERIQGVTYYANETPIQVLVFAHANQSGQNSEIHLFVNGTKVADTSGRPLGVAEESNKTIIATIPKYASYVVEVSNYHHYEWREYKILSGQNGSVNLTNNYYNISGIDNTSLNLKVNKSGDIMTGDLNMSENDISKVSSISNNSGHIEIYASAFGNISGTTYDTTIENETSIYYNTKRINISSLGASSNTGLDFTVQNNTISFLSDNGASQILINETGGSTSSASETGYILWARFNSSQSYNSSMLSLNIFSYTAGANMRMAIYNGNGSNAPYQLLSESASQAITSTGWNNISYPAIQINGSGTEYWISMQTQNTAVVYYASGTGKYKAQAYGAFPTLAGSTLTTDAINMRIYSDVGIVQKRYCLRATYAGNLYTVEC